jgi:biopolymer transport protein ExbD
MDEPRLELMPLIDVVFLLLTFFVFAMVLSARLEVTQIQLPRATSGAESPEVRRYVVLGLNAKGELQLDGAPLAWENAGEALAAALEGGEGEEAASLLVAPDARAPSGDLFRLVDMLQAMEITDLRFLREPSDSGSGAGASPAGDAEPGP